MKRYVIYSLEDRKYYNESGAGYWSQEVSEATKYESITEARTKLYKDGFPSGYYEIKEIFIR